MFYKVTFYKVTPTLKKNQACHARTQADGAVPTTALRLYSLHEQVEQVERVSVGWTGGGLKAIAATVARAIVAKEASQLLKKTLLPSQKQT
jgi:hypothetical protein